MPKITTKLLRDATNVSPTAPPGIAIDDAGIALEIELAPGRALAEASLSIQVPDDSAPIDLLAEAISTTSTGAGDLTTLAAWGPVAWVVLDWRARRGLVRLDVKLQPSAGGQVPQDPGVPPPKPQLLRLRLSTNDGPWILATPLALVPLVDVNGALSASVQLPGLDASRIMIEVVTPPTDPLGPEDYVSMPAAFASLSLTGSRRPSALSLGVPPTAVVHHEPSLLPPSAVLTVREPLLSALVEALPGTAGGSATIVIRSPGAAFLDRLELKLGSSTEVTSWRGEQAELELPVGIERDATGYVDLDAHPTAFAARVEVELQPERPPVVLTPPPTGYGHRSNPDSALAQGFCFAEGVDLLGVDLMLASRSRSVRGLVTIHSDEHGRPSEPPLATIPLDLPEEKTRDPASWRLFDLPEPLSLDPNAVVWVVLAIAAGEADWALAGRPPAADDPSVADKPPMKHLLRRRSGEAWVSRDMTFEEGPRNPWALTRPRLRRVGPPPALDLCLCCGDKELALVPDAAGRIALGEAALAPLFDDQGSASLDVRVRSNIAGKIRLSELRVSLPVERDTWTFPA